MPRNANLRIAPAQKSDLPRLIDIIIPNFDHDGVNKQIGMPNTPEGRAFAVGIHLKTWEDHERNFQKVPCVIKCIHTDPSTGVETIVSTAYCFIYDHERTEAEYRRQLYFISAEWMEDEEVKRRIAAMLKPADDSRIKWFAGKPHGLLGYMATDPKFQRMGAASMCVRWFVDRCMELGIPASLEASPDGAPVYAKLGFETVDEIDIGTDRLPVMVVWPSHYTDEAKKPVLPAWPSV